jgi:hypothetical protein
MKQLSTLKSKESGKEDRGLKILLVFTIILLIIGIVLS